MGELKQRWQNKLDLRQQKGELRTLFFSSPSASRADFFSNDYLGFARSVELKQRIHTRLTEQNYLLGATGSRLLSGHNALVAAVENDLASHLDFDSALIFNSGYTLNLGLISCLAEKSDVILMDEYAHASLKAGAKLSAGQTYFFRHNSLEHLEGKLRRLSHKDTTVFVVVESLYSMDGDLAPLLEISRLCQEYGAQLIVDEAHALGTIKVEGSQSSLFGLVHQLGLQKQVLATILTFGKALGGHGACVLGSSTLRNYLINFCQTFIYTTALAPHSLVHIEEAFSWLAQDQMAYLDLQQNMNFFNQRMGLSDQRSPIYAFQFSSKNVLRDLVQNLKNQGIDALPIFSPTVRRGQERLRVCLHAFNTRVQMSLLADEIERAYAG